MFSQFDSEEVEAYLKRLNVPLKKMSPEDRAELHQELRQHLDALVLAYMELGLAPHEAVAAALRQLGDPRRIGRKMFQEWHRSLPRTSDLAPLLFPLVMYSSVFYVSFSSPPTPQLAWTLLLTLPIVFGGATGFVLWKPAIRRSFFRETFPAHVLASHLVLFLLLSFGIWNGVAHHAILPGTLLMLTMITGPMLLWVLSYRLAMALRQSGFGRFRFPFRWSEG